MFFRNGPGYEHDVCGHFAAAINLRFKDTKLFVVHLNSCAEMLTSCKTLYLITLPLFRLLQGVKGFDISRTLQGQVRWRSGQKAQALFFIGTEAKVRRTGAKLEFVP